MKFEFNADKYATGSGSNLFEGIVPTLNAKGEEIGSTVASIILSNGDNEITTDQYEALQLRADYETLLKDGVFSVKSTVSAKPTTDDTVVVKTDSKPPKTESPNRALPTV